MTTKMKISPAMNSNQDAMALTGLLRVCGIEPSMNGDGLEIMPKAPPQRYVLDTQLLRLEVEPGRIGGAYRAPAARQYTLHSHLSKGAKRRTANTGRPNLRGRTSHA